MARLVDKPAQRSRPAKEESFPTSPFQSLLLLRVPRSSLSLRATTQSLNNGRRSPPQALLLPQPPPPQPLPLLRHLLLHNPKVSNRIVRLSAIDPDGVKREVIGLSGQTLLKALANFGLIDPLSHRIEDIEACSAECEVSIAEEWLEKLPPRSHDEEYVLERSSRVRVLNRHSRLGCQVVLTPEMQGMVVAVPDPKPWDTP